MLKAFATLIRGRSADAAEAITDANALSILRQQLRDAAQGLDKAKRAVAVVMAYAEREKKNATRIDTQLADLETRAMDAIEKGRDDLATEAAGVIAQLEAERKTTQEAIATYEAQVHRLREEVSLAEQRLKVLQRGKHLAEATSHSQKLRGAVPSGVTASLAEAEATLERLQERQSQADATAVAMTELNAGTSAEATSARLAAAGCGDPLKPDAAAVLDRLRKKAGGKDEKAA